MQTYDVSSNALTQAMALGLGEDPERLVSLLADFARRSAIATHRHGNRRYGGYVLEVDGPRIYGIAKYQSNAIVCKDCYGTRIHRMRDGVRWVEVPCQSCMEGRQ